MNAKIDSEQLYLFTSFYNGLIDGFHYATNRINIEATSSVLRWVLQGRADSFSPLGNFNETKNQLGPATDRYFLADMGYMGPRSIVGDTALFCDLAVIKTITDQLCDLNLPGR